jgi:beta-lactamase superfamily II metal-dependent hydrolase
MGRPSKRTGETAIFFRVEPALTWELYIHQLDVFQGESALIVARNTDDENLVRTMLIDGGRSNQAKNVHDYVAANIFNRQMVDRIVTTHYDEDHSGGIEKLLIADNRCVVYRTLADAAGAAAHNAANAVTNNGLLNQVASAAAAATAAAVGGYGTGNAVAVEAGVIGATALNGAVVSANAAAQLGRLAVTLDLLNRHKNLPPQLLPRPNKRNQVCEAAGKVAGTTAGTVADRATAAYHQIEARLATSTALDSCFNTNGTYNTSTVIDVGDEIVTSEIKYRNAIEGKISLSSDLAVEAPGISRWRVTPALNAEILWNVGKNAQPAPLGAPAVFVVACNRYVRNAAARCGPIGGDPSNNVSFGLIIRFNNFFFYTGGDLPCEGEKLILQDIYHKGLPDPQQINQFFIEPNYICAFKCGHHGSKTSTSPDFVGEIRAKVALISTGAICSSIRTNPWSIRCTTTPTFASFI